MTATGYAQALRTEGARLTAIAAEAEASDGALQRRVRSCPDWDLEALLEHCCGVWTFVGSSVAAGSPIDRASITRPAGQVSQWHAEAFGRLLEVMEARRPGEAVWTFDPDRQVIDFWWRRMTHEATLHRWDAESALGVAPAPIEADLAVDGIDELFEFAIGVRQPTVFAGNGETVHLHATDADGEWVVTRTPDGIEVEHAHRKCDVAARGSAQDLLLFVWGRGGTDQLETFGDGSLLTDWQRLVRI